MHGTRDEYIAYRESKSEEAFEDAKLLLENGRWNACVNRLYYSAFYLISAILFKENIKVETHNGAKTKFFLHFVKSGQVTKHTENFIRVCLTGEMKAIILTL